ncbi:MAG: carbamoyltransferase HypF [Pseudomonadota bacterium]
MASRARIQIAGVVQGVGFRPFVYRLADELALTGWVNNNPRGVTIEIEGDSKKLDEFLLRLSKERPSLSVIANLETSFLDPAGYKAFEVRPSEEGGEKSAWILPDIATCSGCLDEILDPTNRRYRYPFTNCTHCGPRFTIIRRLPYDRKNTTMEAFPMCLACQAEYDDPGDRRFHAQPNACPVCGPQLSYCTPNGHEVEAGDAALRQAVEGIRKGKIIACKGLGGFHLLCDARDDAAVQLLRKRKHREEKPLAVMFPSLEGVKRCCHVTELEERRLLSLEAPIVLLPKDGEKLAQSVAPENPYLGILLPYTPLHHLLLRDLGFPVVATSGNRSEEPICTDEKEAFTRLGDLADGFLVHNRPITRHADDSIVRMIGGREAVMRRARGYAPMPISLRVEMPPIVAVGAHLKNTLAFSRGKDVFVSQHIGDLENAEAIDAFEKVLSDFPELYEIQPEAVVTDCHPDYASSRTARELEIRLIEAQHHHAHIRSCMAENDLSGEVLGVAWDGVGLGEDGALWGGEFLVVDGATYRRAGHFRYFPLPGGERAIREPRRIALGLLFELLGKRVFDDHELLSIEAFSAQEIDVLQKMLVKNLNSPLTSGAGRLFDAVSSILGLCQCSRYEGQGGMKLEFAASNLETDRSYPFELIRKAEQPVVVDWAGIVRGVLGDWQEKRPTGEIAAAFHNSLVETIVRMAKETAIERVVLSGGCFQNRRLTERAIARLGAKGFRCYWHQRVPPNDGGISLGQIAIGAEILKRD